MIKIDRKERKKQDRPSFLTLMPIPLLFSLYLHEFVSFQFIFEEKEFHSVCSVKDRKRLTMNIFRKKYFLFKSFVKIELSYSFTINIVSTAENCKEK